MTNTGAVSQLPIAADAAADRSRSAGRKGAANSDDGGFPGFLSKLSGNRGRDDSDAAPAQDTRSGDGDRSVGGWRRGNAEVRDENTGDGDHDTPSGDPALAQQDNDIAALLALVTASDAALQSRPLPSTDVLAGASALAAMVTRVANGTATEAETALVQAAVVAEQNGDALSPEQFLLASLAKASGRGGEQPAAEPTITATTTVTVLRRETHLAPAPAPAATPVDAGTALAADFGVNGNRALRPPAQPSSEAPADAALLRTGNADDANAQAPPALQHAAVTAARNAHLGADLRRGAAPMADLQAAADGPQISGSGTAGPEHVLAITRTDALVNAAPASGVAQQIADRVAAEASTLTAPAGRPSASGLDTRQTLGSAVKVLYIHLTPADLGTVTIRMSVKDQALQLDLEVGRGDTAQLIQRDREALSSLLRSAGYLIDAVDVKVADQSSANLQAGNNQANTQMQSGGQSGSSQADARSAGARAQDERGGNAFRNGRNGEDQQAGQPNRGSGVYV